MKIPLIEWLDATVPPILLVILLLDESLLSVFELVGLDYVLECVMVGLGPKGQDGWCLGTEPGATGLPFPFYWDTE